MSTMMRRAYAALTIKATDTADSGGKRRFAGVATTPTVDRMGDIVEPEGAEFKLPIPLLWQHDSRQPIGWVTTAKVTSAGIDIEGEVATIDEPGKLQDRLTEAWQSMKIGLVRGLSIGFQPLESSRIEGTYSYRYLKWLWLELSSVTIAANGDASITAIKAADQAIRRAALGARPVVRLDGASPAASAAGLLLPGAAGTSSAPAAPRKKGVVYLAR